MSLTSAGVSGLLVSLGALAGGCAHWPATPRLEQAGAPGYRVDHSALPGQSDHVLLLLNMTGVGPSAAAVGCVVFEELQRFEVNLNGLNRRLIDQDDVISAVSRGPFPA